MKLVNNLLLAANVQLAVEALRLGTSMGVEPTELASAVAQCSGATRALGMVAGFDPGRAAYEDLRRFLHKDVLVALAVAAESGVDPGFLGAVAGAGPARFGEDR